MDIKEKALDLFDSAKEPAAEVACSLLLEGVIGTVVPGVMNSVLAYKQKRQERMFEKFMIEIKNRILVLEEKLIQLEPERFQEIQDRYLGLVSDYALEEVQEEKIKYIVNGFMNVVNMTNASEDFVLSYYDTLKELRMVDIGVLKFYYEVQWGGHTRTFQDILDEFDIEYEQYEAVRERLLRLGLLTSKREQKEDDLYKNILLLQDVIEKSLKGQKLGTVRFNRLDKKDSIVISKFGREFLNFFVND